MWLCREEAREIRGGYGTTAEDLFGEQKHEAVGRNQSIGLLTGLIIADRYVNNDLA